MKIIAYSLWGEGKKYIIGAKRNIELCKEFYPEYEPLFCVSHNFNADVIQELESCGAHLLRKEDEWNDYRCLFWRLELCCSTIYERVLSRDTDSRPNKREAAAVKEWEQTDYPVHIMRDHVRFHGAHIMGGMFGVVPRVVEAFTLKSVLSYVTGLEYTPTPLGDYWGCDQKYLKQVVWPRIKDNHLAHDDCRRKTKKERRFKVPLGPGMFVGQRYDENDKPEMV